MWQVVDSANPIVFARLGCDPTQPTVTIHGHYDVQVQSIGTRPVNNFMD
jgi:hypothetical protein